MNETRQSVTLNNVRVGRNGTCQPTLILTDYRLPGEENGFDIIRRARQLLANTLV